MYRDMRGVMVHCPFIANPEMTLPQAEIYMLECGIRHLPLIVEKEVVGIVSQRDILSHKKTTDFKSLTLGDIALKNPFVVSENEPLSTTAGVMAHSKLGSALVINDDSELVGIFTTTDALLLLRSLLTGDPKFLQKPGEVIYLKDVSGWN